MNDAVIIAVANAITANAEVLKSLIDALPRETRVAVEEKVVKATTKKAPAASTETPAPVVVETTTAPVVETATPAVIVPTTPAMPAAPFPTAPVVVDATLNKVFDKVFAKHDQELTNVFLSTPAATPVQLPFSDHKGLLAYVMSTYQALPKDRGMQIQNVLNSIGVHNINDVKPEQYAALFAGVEALKNG